MEENNESRKTTQNTGELLPMIKVIKFPKTKHFISQDDTLCIRIPDTNIVLKIPPVSLMAAVSKILDRTAEKSQIAKETFQLVKNSIREKQTPSKKSLTKEQTPGMILADSQNKGETLIEFVNHYVNEDNPYAAFTSYELDLAAKVSLDEAFNILIKQGFKVEIISLDEIMVYGQAVLATTDA